MRSVKNREVIRRCLAAFSLFGLLLMAQAGWSAPVLNGGRAGRETDRSPQLPPDVVPAIRLENIKPAKGKFISIYYASGARLAPGASAWTPPELREVRKASMDVRVREDGTVRFDAESFERTAPNRVNYIIFVTSAAPLARSYWRNGDGTCPIAVDSCSNPSTVIAMAAIPVSLLVQEPGDDAVRIDAGEWLKIIRRAP